VVDLGCWPGGWLQVAAREVGKTGRVVGVDRRALEPPLEGENLLALAADLEEPQLAERVREALGGPADVVLCDAAPTLTGVRDADRAAEERLLESVERLLPELLRPGGDALVKLLESPEAQAAVRRLRARFASAKVVRPAATRKGSSERYLLAKGFSP
jgi:23S rRNA (uridine2552-2'-O)-methyltransferase